MMRAIARAMLSLYPRAWRQRYGDEVGDLIAARPARVRTVIDLIGGAADAWFHHKRIPGAKPLRVPLAAVLSVAGVALWLLWSQGVRAVAGAHGDWATAAGMGGTASGGGAAARLRDLATVLHVGASAMALLSVATLIMTCHTASRHSLYGAVTRMTARRVVVTAVLLALPVALVGLSFYSLTAGHAGPPVGPLGEAMAGGFHTPIILALVLSLPTIASGAPSLSSDVRGAGKLLAVAAVSNAIAWVPVAILMLLGMPGVTWPFVAVAVLSALAGIGMGALAGVSAVRLGRTAAAELSLA
ncbi:hypothetical protein [Nonomuraea zeae]|uniref:Uncharacterized protein n=1 Tax=Nonomuraea zeae TaxID=1642303 RepID=A0A5S4GBI1_9ACTN|nr:hypothetical protein [Nonomuraea zeae]TMR23380.1 hypothetical protein ETD85_48030 [Nonomuraea zeae]